MFAVINRASYAARGQSHAEKRVNVNDNTSQHMVTQYLTDHLAAAVGEKVHARVHTWFVSPTIIHIPIYGEICVCEGWR